MNEITNIEQIFLCRQTKITYKNNIFAAEPKSVPYMNKHLPISKASIRFRRWSRKEYAVFASLGKCVTIGFLSKSVADQSLAKQLPEECRVESVPYVSDDVREDCPPALPLPEQLCELLAAQQTGTSHALPAFGELMIFIYNVEAIPHAMRVLPLFYSF